MVLPKTRTMAIVEFDTPTDARRAFRSLAYRSVAHSACSPARISLARLQVLDTATHHPLAYAVLDTATHHPVAYTVLDTATHHPLAYTVLDTATHAFGSLAYKREGERRGLQGYRHCHPRFRLPRLQESMCMHESSL